MPRRRKGRRSRKAKIPILATAGLVLTLKHLWDVYNSAAPEVRGEAMTAALTGWRGPHLSDPNTFDYTLLIPTYAPVVAGTLASKYVGGPKGLNANAALRGVPFVRL